MYNNRARHRPKSGPYSYVGIGRNPPTTHTHTVFKTGKPQRNGEYRLITERWGFRRETLEDIWIVGVILFDVFKTGRLSKCHISYNNSEDAEVLKTDDPYRYVGSSGNSYFRSLKRNSRKCHIAHNKSEAPRAWLIRKDMWVARLIRLRFFKTDRPGNSTYLIITEKQPVS